MKRKEDHVQAAVCQYVQTKYPEVWYKSDLSGENMPGYNAQRKQKLAKQRGFSDLALFPLNVKFGFVALELKIETEKLVKKKRSTGQLEWVDSHVKEQAEWIEHIIKCGHHASFGIGYNHSIRIIDAVMSSDLALLNQISVITIEQAFNYQTMNNNTVWHQIQKASQQRAKSSR